MNKKNNYDSYAKMFFIPVFIMVLLGIISDTYNSEIIYDLFFVTSIFVLIYMPAFLVFIFLKYKKDKSLYKTNIIFIISGLVTGLGSLFYGITNFIDPAEYFVLNKKIALSGLFLIISNLVFILSGVLFIILTIQFFYQKKKYGK